MFTTPDQSDAATTLPPIAPPGPRPAGFFADCNPAQSFDGTRPIADYFNELIVNLRALLTKAGVAAVKGDATMLWQAVLRLPVITTAVTLNVAAGGVANPVDPIAGNPFDTLLSALLWLARYRIAPGGSVTIAIAAGTHTVSSGASGAAHVIFHPDGIRLAVKGAGVTQTTLSFPGTTGGLYIPGRLNDLLDLTIAGDNSGIGSGLQIDGFCGVSNVTIRNFGGAALSADTGTAVLRDGTTLTVQNSNLGIWVQHGGSVVGPTATIVASNNTAGNISVAGGLLDADIISTTGGQLGLQVGGTASQVYTRKLGVDACVNTAGVFVFNGAALIAKGGAVAGDWWTWNNGAATPQNFRAEVYGLIRADAALAASNRTNCSPAINTLGNTQAYILAV